MDDEFMHGLRSAPSPAFARRLRARLHRLEGAPRARTAPSPVVRWAAVAATFAAVGGAFTFPAVRAGAEAFLDLFRVVNVSAVAVDPQRLEELEATGLDLQTMIGEQVEILEEAAPGTSYAVLEEAGVAAGIRARAPTWLPPGWRQTSVEVLGAYAMRVTADTTKLQALLDAFGIDDVAVPEGIDGQDATLRSWPLVRVAYGSDASALTPAGGPGGPGAVTLVQGRSPDVRFPAGLDLPALAEIGLRVLGLDRKEAYRVARSIDWRTTLVIPVPATAQSFREVDVQGNRGLLIETAPMQGPRRRTETVLLWASGGEMYALRGILRAEELLAMAQSMQ